jgi:hypothetical protein
MFQTLMQSTRLAQHEYINAFGSDGWRDVVHTTHSESHSNAKPPTQQRPSSSLRSAQHLPSTPPQSPR